MLTRSSLLAAIVATTGASLQEYAWLMLVLVAHAGDAGAELTLTVGDKSDVPELQRRTASVLARGRDER